MWKEVPRTRKKEVLSSHHVESSRPSLTTVSLEVPSELQTIEYRRSNYKPIEVLQKVGSTYSPLLKLNVYILREVNA